MHHTIGHGPCRLPIKRLKVANRSGLETFGNSTACGLHLETVSKSVSSSVEPIALTLMMLNPRAGAPC